MHTKLIPILFALWRTADALSTPLVAREAKPDSSPDARDYVELSTLPAKIGDGTIVFFGIAPSGMTKRQDAVGVQKRDACRVGAQTTCSADNGAENDLCDKLLTNLQGYGDQPVPGSPRQACYKGSPTGGSTNDYCCVTWHDTTSSTLYMGDLWQAAHPSEWFPSNCSYLHHSSSTVFGERASTLALALSIGR
jgi:hypothetical protein